MNTLPSRNENFPTVPFIEGDGVGPDIWKATKLVLDQSVKKAYGKKRAIEWKEVLAGEKAYRETGTWLPASTLEAFKNYQVGIKGPLTTPVGGQMRSLNVALRQLLDLYVCLRPVRWFQGVPSALKHPEKTNMVIFRENSEDIYAGIEFEQNSREIREFLEYLRAHFPEQFKKIRFPNTCGIGLKPVSQEGTQRLVKAALQYAFEQNCPSLTLVHKGNIMKYTEGAFCQWAYQTAEELYHLSAEGEGTWKNLKLGNKSLLLKDVIADAFLQQIITRAEDYSVIATLNLNGDYISDALAACVGGIGIAPGGNINYETKHAIFEATHGTAPKYANKDKVNPGSLILSGEMLLRHLGWNQAAQFIIDGMEKTIAKRTVTYDFHRFMDEAVLLSCSQFASAVVDNM